MNDELNQDSLQPPVDSELSPEEAKAALGLSTRLSEEFLMSQTPQEDMSAPVERQEAQGEAQPQEPINTPSVDPEVLKKEINEEVKRQVEDQLGPIKEALQNALNEEDEA